MKIVLRVLLLAAIALLVYMCIRSILTPIQFEDIKKEREKVIVESLIDIRDAQIGYRNKYGVYAANFETLQNFLGKDSIAFVSKSGELTDAQLKAGLTEKKAMEMIAKAIKTGKYDEVKKNGLENFRRDTTKVLAVDTLFNHKVDIAKFGKVPGFESNTFGLDTATLSSPSGYTVPVFQCEVPYDVYLKDLDAQLLYNLKDKMGKLNRYQGLRVGSIEEINNNAGNWEQF
ncbi:MAG: hypothetical protein LBD53_10360 [Tannerella sp.]|jgi:hypothetical protein|nr:hypothetical protein [Tannerella sp.]